jgi:hypothetical protein
MSKITEVYAAMEAYREKVTPASTCDAWEDFLFECTSMYGVNVIEALEIDVEVDEEWSEYWFDVTKGVSIDYHWRTGQRLP